MIVSLFVFFDNSELSYRTIGFISAVQYQSSKVIVCSSLYYRKDDQSRCVRGTHDWWPTAAVYLTGKQHVDVQSIAMCLQVASPQPSANKL